MFTSNSKQCLLLVCGGRLVVDAVLKIVQHRLADLTMRSVLAIVAKADVLIEGYRRGVAECLGLGPEDCEKVNARLVTGRMTGWGQDGPRALQAGHDIKYISLNGVLHAIGRRCERDAFAKAFGAHDRGH